MRRRLTGTGNRIAVGLYRRVDGRPSSDRKDVNVLLIAVPVRTHPHPCPVSAHGSARGER